MNQSLEATATQTNAQALRLLIFYVGAQRFAADLNSIERVTRAAALTPLPPSTPAPPFIAGVLNVGGRVLPVFDGRLLFHDELRNDDLTRGEKRAPQLSDEFLITNFQSVVWVERVEGVWECPPQNGLALNQQTSGKSGETFNNSPVRGLVKRDGELIWVCDFAFLPAWKNAPSLPAPASATSF